MIARYTNPEMGGIWSDQRRYETWLEVELAAADAMAEAGLIPRADAAEMRAKAGFDIARIEEIEQVTQHDVIAFTTAVAEKVGPAARWLHFGLTSSDVIDTAQALQMREACTVIVKNVSGLMEAVRDRAEEHRRTAMIGRTHGVHAEPMTSASSSPCGTANSSATWIGCCAPATSSRSARSPAPSAPLRISIHQSRRESVRVSAWSRRRCPRR